MEGGRQRDGNQNGTVRSDIDHWGKGEEEEWSGSSAGGVPLMGRCEQRPGPPLWKRWGGVVHRRD